MEDLYELKRRQHVAATCEHGDPKQKRLEFRMHAVAADGIHSFRVVQGHSQRVYQMLEPQLMWEIIPLEELPRRVYHGTYRRYLDSIF